jgi:hypothetical protein
MNIAISKQGNTAIPPTRHRGNKAGFAQESLYAKSGRHRLVRSFSTAKRNRVPKTGDRWAAHLDPTLKSPTFPLTFVSFFSRALSAKRIICVDSPTQETYNPGKLIARWNDD